MIQSDLLAEQESTPDRSERFELGRGHWLYLPHGPRGQGDGYHHGSLSKGVDLRDKAARRLLVVELIQHGVNQTRLAEALKLSRQSLHNDRESYREFGVHGLLHGYRPKRSKDEEQQRHIHVHKRRPGSKARELEALRRAKRERAESGAQAQLPWEGEVAEPAAHVLEEPAIEETLGGSAGSVPIGEAAERGSGERTSLWAGAWLGGESLRRDFPDPAGVGEPMAVAASSDGAVRHSHIDIRLAHLHPLD